MMAGTRDPILDAELAEVGIHEGDYDDEPMVEITLLAAGDGQGGDARQPRPFEGGDALMEGGRR
jgi:hypothetical protein